MVWWWWIIPGFVAMIGLAFALSGLGWMFSRPASQRAGVACLAARCFSASARSSASWVSMFRAITA